MDEWKLAPHIFNPATFTSQPASPPTTERQPPIHVGGWMGPKGSLDVLEETEIS